MHAVNSLASTVGRRSKSHSPNKEIHRKHDKNFSENPVLDIMDCVGIRNSTGPHSHLHYSGISSSLVELLCTCGRGQNLTMRTVSTRAGSAEVLQFWEILKTQLDKVPEQLNVILKLTLL